MRILAITNLYPRPGRPNLAPFHRQQFAALSEAHDLSVLAPVAWVEELRDHWSGRPIVRRRRVLDRFEVSHPRYLYPPRFARGSLGWFYLASVRGEATRLIREGRPEVILASWAHPDGWASVRLAREAGLPCVIKVVGSDVLVQGRSGGRRRRIAEALQAADAVTAVSQDLADQVIALGVDPDRVFRVSEGLDSGLFQPGDRDQARTRIGWLDRGPMLLYVGNLRMSKGPGVLIEAVERLDRQGLKFQTALVGQGPDEARLRAIVAARGLTRRVAFVGSRPIEELPDWYRSADLATLPSFSEGSPNVLREAGAVGRGFVATRVGGIPEIARESTAILVPPGDPTALARAIAEGLDWGPRTPVSWPTWSESADQLAGVLRQVVEARRPTPTFAPSR